MKKMHPWYDAALYENTGTYTAPGLLWEHHKYLEVFIGSGYAPPCSFWKSWVVWHFFTDFCHLHETLFRSSFADHFFPPPYLIPV